MGMYRLSILYPKDDLVISVNSLALAAYPPHIRFYITTIFTSIGGKSGQYVSVISALKSSYPCNPLPQK